MKYYARFAFMLGLAACAGDETAITPDNFVAPTTPAEVEDLYAQLATCSDSFVTRTLTPRAEIRPTSIWTTPAADPAGLLAWRATAGWNRVLLANELTFDGVAEDMKSTDPACVAAHRLLTPVESTREQFTHALLYLDEPAHPYAAYPDGGIEAKRAPVPVSLLSYLNVIFAERQASTGGDVTYSDVTEQHLPMYISCKHSFEVETTVAMFDARELPQVDASMCDEGTDVDNDGDLDHRCVAERGLHAEGNTCTFVVDASSLVTLDGTRRPAIFGGTLETRGTGTALAYSFTIDRFSN
ncbi:MAG: hypothetical protein HOV81_44490 [Kofleriaceae bacterium]|nr:hypothetical protein [Kofleriaceae bacterium]